MPPFYYIFLAIYRILCFVIRGATSTPVDGSPFDFFLISFGGNLLLYYPQSIGKGGGRYVRYMGQFVSVPQSSGYFSLTHWGSRLLVAPLVSILYPIWGRLSMSPAASAGDFLLPGKP